jgi:hypothetical protein
MEGQDLLQSPAMHLNWPLSPHAHTFLTLRREASGLRSMRKNRDLCKQATTNTARDLYYLLSNIQAPYEVIRSYTGLIASMNTDRDEKSTPEELKAREEEDRAREQREQAGMRIIFC